MIEAQGLVKNFGAFVAVDQLDLQIPSGDCFGLLGPNGAGKSTLINMLYGATLKTSGTLKVFGLDPEKDGRAIKKRLGVVTQENALDESLTVQENMLIYGAYLGLPPKLRGERVQELLKEMNLEHKAGVPIRTLSGGMKRRLVFVRALLGDPELVILDEPTTGLDPAVRHLLWRKVKGLRQLKKSVLLTTHYMHEAEILCDRVAIMNKGKVLVVDSPKNLIQQHVPGFVAVYEDCEEVRWALRNEKFVADHSGVSLRTLTFEEIIGKNRSFGITALQIRPSNLEDVFLKLTGEELTSHD